MEHRVSKSFYEKWPELFYSRVTSQFVLSRQSMQTTHQWVITLTVGLVTAVLAVSGQKYPNEFGFVGLLLSMPLMFRFFVRSCIELSIQYKLIEIRNAQDRLCALRNAGEPTEDAERYLQRAIQLYYFEWKSPKSLCYLVCETLQLVYLWPFLVLTILLLWGATTLAITPLIGAAVSAVALFQIWELIRFVSYSGFKRADPGIAPAEPHYAIGESMIGEQLPLGRPQLLG
jgi:hypothetical protein